MKTNVFNKTIFDRFLYDCFKKTIVFEKKIFTIMLTIVNEGSSLTIVNEGSSLTIVSERSSLTIVNEGSSLTIVKERASLTIVNETTNFIKTVVFGEKNHMQLF